MNNIDIKQRYWHAVYVSSRQEKKVMEQLQLKEVEAYVPLVKTLRQWSDRKKMVEFPLINGYVFLNISRLEHELIYDVRGIVNFVRTEEKIAVIRENEIDRLKQLVSLGYQIEAEAIGRTYREGDKVRINSGVMAGVEGYVVDRGNGKNMEVLLESIGQCIRIKLPQEAFSMIEETALVLA